MQAYAIWSQGIGTEDIKMLFNECCIDQKIKNSWMRFCPLCGHYIEYMIPDNKEIKNKEGQNQI